MNDQDDWHSEVIPKDLDDRGDLNNAPQIAHSLLRHMEGKIAQHDTFGAQALATTLQHQLIALEGYGVTREGTHKSKSFGMNVSGLW